MTPEDWKKIIREAVTNEDVMNNLAALLWQCEEAKHHLRREGYGVTGQGILETAKLVERKAPGE